MGNYSKLQKNYLKRKFKTKVKFIKLPIINKLNIKKFALKFDQQTAIGFLCMCIIFASGMDFKINPI